MMLNPCMRAEASMCWFVCISSCSHLKAGRERWRRWGTPWTEQAPDTVNREAEADCRIDRTQNEQQNCNGTACQPHRILPLSLANGRALMDFGQTTQEHEAVACNCETAPGLNLGSSNPYV